MCIKKIPPKIEEPTVKPDTGTSVSPEPTVIVPSTEKPRRKIDLTYILPLVMMALIAIVVVPAAKETQNLLSKAAAPKCQPITKVLLNPGVINTSTGSSPINISTLAYDKNNIPIWGGVKYDWGISSSNGVGTVKARNDLATFTPLHVGTGDLYVLAKNNCTLKAVPGSVKVTVVLGTLPTPTPKGRK